jgi:hypothetical protein
VERDVRDDYKRFFRKLELPGISLDHENVAASGEAFPQPPYPERVVLHRHHTFGRPRELAGKHPSTRTDLDHEVGSSHAGRGDYPARRALVLQKILPRLASAAAPPAVPFPEVCMLLLTSPFASRHLWDHPPSSACRCFAVTREAGRLVVQPFSLQFSGGGLYEKRSGKNQTGKDTRQGDQAAHGGISCPKKRRPA